MTIEQPRNKPALTLRDGTIKATIWKNDTKPDQGSGEVSSFYSVDITRSYQKDGEWKDTTSFSGSELLRVANLSQAAYNAILQMRSDDKAQG